ncbi:hypothetical protein GCM10028807_35000 [Spirosoma daeguense]
METIEVKSNTLLDISNTIPESLEIEVSRATVIDTIERTFDNGIDIVFIEGNTGIGKTTLLTQFAKKNPINSITHFVNPADRFTYDINFFRASLYNQIYFCINNKINPEIQSDITLFEIRPQLDKFIKKVKKPLYFVFDGLNEINPEKREVLFNTIADLPWGKVRFLISGDSDTLQNIIPYSSIKSRSYPLSFFSYTETKDFLKDLTTDETEINELYKIAQKGFPEKLVQVKRLCNQYSVSKFLSEDITEKTDLLEIEWKNVKNAKNHQLLLSLLAFDDYKYTVSGLSKRLKLSTDEVEKIITNYNFLSKNDEIITYISEYFRSFASKKLSKYKQEAINLAIDYYIENPNSDESINNLSDLYQKAKKHKDLIKLLSIENFAILLQSHQSFSSINQQFESGINASFEFDKYSAYFLQFALLKSSFKDIERYEAFESEVDARISLNQSTEAYNIATNAYLKEDRFILLSELAKQKKINQLIVEPELIDQIKELYQQINIIDLGEKSLSIASNLLYSCPDLSIDIIESISKNNPRTSFRDIAYTHLSIDALRANIDTNDLSNNIESITSKIQNQDNRNDINALAGILGDYNSKQIIRRVDDIGDVSRKLFFLENWIEINKNSIEVHEVIAKTLNIIISNSSDELPSSTLLYNIARPLPEIQDVQQKVNLLKIFDSQRNSIVNPREDYIKLQILLAETVATYNYSLAKDRFVEIFFQLDEIKDLCIKSNCLSYLWFVLSKSIYKDTIELEENLVSLVFNDLDSSIEKLLNDTAFHESLVFTSIKNIANIDYNLSLKYLQKINTQYRRDKGLYNIITHYIEQNKIKNINFEYIKQSYNLIYDKDTKERVVVRILNFLSVRENFKILVIDELMFYINKGTELDHLWLKCKALVYSIVILENDGTKKSFTDSLYDLLKSSWSSIDLSWYKVDLGFEISSMFAKVKLNDIATEYLLNSISERESASLLDSTSIPNTYILSIKLAIRAFSALIKNLKDIDSSLIKIENLINVLPSFGEQARLWSDVSLNFYKREKFDLFRKVTKEHVKPNLYSLNDKDKGYKSFIIKNISPTLYLYHPQTFFELIAEMSDIDSDESIYNVCYFIMTKSLLDEPLDFNDKGYELQYEEAKDICLLVEKVNSDEKAFIIISLLIKCLKNYKLVSSQINIIKKDLSTIVDNCFPKKAHGISHDGYKIASQVLLASLDQFNEKKWNALKSQAIDIPNKSDSVFVLTKIAQSVDQKNKKFQLEMLNLAYTESNNIPSNYDRFERLDDILENFSQVSKSDFTKVTSEVIGSINNIQDEDMSEKHNDLIDLMFQHDPDNIDNYLNLIDSDIVKKNKIKKVVSQQIDSLKKRKEVSSNYKNLHDIVKKRDLLTFSENALKQLNSGRTVPKNSNDLYYIVKQALNYTLSDSYLLYSLYIESLLKKYEKSTSQKNVDFLQTIFDATIFNSSLIDILSQNSPIKIKNRLRAINTSVANSDLYFKIGEREKFDSFLRDWVEKNVVNSLNILDPYFTEDDLPALLLIKSVVPECEVFILTSKEGNNNRYENNEEVYKNKWQELSFDSPPPTTVKIIWRESEQNTGRENNFKSPFHDRWWIPDNAQTGLRFGTSYNSVGLSKDSEISIMTVDDAKKVADNAIRDYIEGNVRKYGNERIRNLSFELD